MDDPPSATSLPPATVQEEGGEGAESAPPPPPVEVSASPAPAVATAAPDLIAIPPPIMHLIRGFSGGTLPEGTDRKEGMPFYLGAFLAVALEWRAQARNAALQTQTLQIVPSMVFPSHRYRGTPCQRFAGVLAVPPPSTVFPTCGSQGCDASN